MTAVRVLVAVVGALLAGTLARIWVHGTPRFAVTLTLVVFVIGLTASMTAARRRQRRGQT